MNHDECLTPSTQEQQKRREGGVSAFFDAMKNNGGRGKTHSEKKKVEEMGKRVRRHIKGRTTDPDAKNGSVKHHMLHIRWDLERGGLFRKKMEKGKSDAKVQLDA